MLTLHVLSRILTGLLCSLLSTNHFQAMQKSCLRVALCALALAVAAQALSPTSPMPPKTVIPTTIPGGGDCFVFANNCPSGMECVPNESSWFGSFSDQPRGNCKPIDYTCDIWVVRLRN